METQSEYEIVVDDLKNCKEDDSTNEHISKKSRSSACLLRCLIAGLSIYFVRSLTGGDWRNTMIASCNNSDVCILMKNNAYSLSMFFGKEVNHKIFNSADVNKAKDVDKNGAPYSVKNYENYFHEKEAYSEILKN